MNTRKHLFSALLFGTALSLITRVFAKSTFVKPTASSASYDEIDGYIERQMGRLKIPGVSLAIVEGDVIVHQRGFGQARPGGEGPAPQTPFVIGSLTKSFTALAVMQLVEVEQLELDAPVQRYLPWFRIADPQASTQITVRHLLNQTSGLPQLPGMINLANFNGRPDVTERQARNLSTLALARPVGSAFEYSNLNYNLLGLIIEAASGESYADYIQHHIFAPLEMSHSYTSQTMAKRNGLAVGHRYWFGFPIATPNLPLPRGSLPSGQLIASAEDMGHYLIAHLNDGRYRGRQILSKNGMSELHRPAAEASAMGISLGYYGMGWFVEKHDQTTILSHTGTVPDFFAFMALLPEQDKGMVLLINANHAIMDKLSLSSVGMDAAQLLAGETPKPTRVGATPWVLRGLLLIPILQFLSVVMTLRRIRRWQVEPDSRPSNERKWVRHILLPLIPNLAMLALPLSLWSSGLLRFMRLFVPDITWIALTCGGFAGTWTVLRTGLILHTLRARKRTAYSCRSIPKLLVRFVCSKPVYDRVGAARCEP